MSSIQLRSQALINKRDQELSQQIAFETTQLRQQKVLLGFGAVAFIAAFAMSFGLLA